MLRLSTILLLGAALALPATASAQDSTADGTESPSSDGWTIQPRGRLQVDLANIDAPSGVTGDHFGTTAEVRRAFIGVDGTLPGKIGYRVEVDVAGSSVQLTDGYLTYRPGQALVLTLGQHKPFFGLEEQTSDLFTSMLERAAFTSAFGFERRLGLSGTYSSDALLVQAGFFTVNAADLDADDDSYGFDGRVVYSPRLGAGTLHLGGSAHVREIDPDAGTVRYRARPFSHTTDTRLVDTGTIAATGERSFGLELAYVAGPLHATLEGHRLTALRPGLPNASFHGGYAEVGMLVTPGDTTAYKGGAYDRIRPVRPLGRGGIGAIQLNLRYDRLDLNDEPTVGGRQQALGLSAIWIPAASVRLQANYGRLWISDAAVPAGADADYAVDTLGLRAQFDF